MSQALNIASDYQFGFKEAEDYIFKAKPGLSKEIVEAISSYKKEPSWMRDFRLKSLATFYQKPMPSWGPKPLEELDFSSYHYYIRPTDQVSKSWEDVPAGAKRTFERLGIPEAERQFLAGVKAQFESEVVYSSLKEELAKQAVIFLDTDTAVRDYPELVKEYFGTIVPPDDNKFAALNSAVWSGGSFIYIPKGVSVEMPLQAYFRINAEAMGQFERTLIIADEGSFVHYVEGCSAPIYAKNSLHSAVVEIVVKKGARVRYTTIQNWSKNVFNLVTKRAFAYRDATMEWVDANLGSRLTMKYPSVYLKEPGAKAEILSVALAGEDQRQDAGGKVIHQAKNTTSTITSKSVSFQAGRTSYRGLVLIEPEAKGAKSNVVCDALLIDGDSVTDTYPTIDVKNDEVSIGHEATVEKISDDQLLYLTSRGVSEAEARSLLVNGFIEPLIKSLPMEYAVEMNRLIELEMEGSVG